MAEHRIKCSVGILTFNSAEILRRTLESVRDFSNIIISDGGSTDGTLDIAREYGCTVIDQYSKTNPGNNLDHPINDFARERNLMLDVATEDWFFWIDSDEYISDELHDEIEKVCMQIIPKYYAYRIPIIHQNPEGTVTYRKIKQNYQIRFFNLTTGGRFQRKMHEKFTFDEIKYQTGQLSGDWYVPMKYIDFPSYKKVITYRLGVMIESAPHRTFLQYLTRALYQTTKTSLGIVGRYILSSIFFPRSTVVPFWSVRQGLYSQWFLFKKLSYIYYFRR